MLSSTIFEPSSLPTMQAPDQWTHVVFESPWIAMGGVLLLGVLMMLALRSRDQMKAGIVVFVGSLVISGGLVLSSMLVLTDREALEVRAHELVDAVVEIDSTAMRSIMSERMSLDSTLARSSSRDQLISLIERRVGGLVSSARVVEVRSDMPGDRVGRTLIKIKASSSDASYGSSWWMVHWERESTETHEWMSTVVQPVWIQGVLGPES